METGQIKKERKKEDNIELIIYRIGNIEKDMTEIKNELKFALTHFVQKEDFLLEMNEKLHPLEMRINDVCNKANELENRKLAKEEFEKEFEPIKTGINRLVWLIILVVVGAILSLVILK